MKLVKTTLFAVAVGLTAGCGVESDSAGPSGPTTLPPPEQETESSTEPKTNADADDFDLPTFDPPSLEAPLVNPPADDTTPPE